MTVLSWAETHISAAHKGGDGRIHGHSWKIRAYWPDVSDITEKQRALNEECSHFDHDILPDKFNRAESLAERIGERLQAVKVEVWRPVEGLGAIWTP